MLTKIPIQVKQVLKQLQESGFEAHAVGGCVRDLMMNRQPKDWDIATNAIPEEVIAIFPDSFYENDFGTVGVKVPPFDKNTEKKKDREHDVIEVTTYRIESTYSDRRRPDDVKFAKTLQEDLGRRDFTMNAIALNINENNTIEIVDLFEGQKDISKKIIRTVGNSSERFNEDALRMIRAIRFHAELGFEIEINTFEAIKEYSSLISHIANERLKDEISKIILSNNPAEGIEMMQKTGLLKLIIPELEYGIGIAQNRHHIYPIYNHLLLSLKNCPSKKLEVRLAALFHDIAKPQTKRGDGYLATFYNHDHVGAKIVRNILQRLKFSNEIISKVTMLVDNHMFYYNPDEVSASSVRKLIKKVGLENMHDLVDLRIADRLGSGTPKAKPYKLRHLEYMIDHVSHDAVSVKMLKINGNDLMREIAIKPGPAIGAILDVLLSEVIEDAQKNTPAYLLSRATELKNENLENLREMAKEKIEERKEDDDKKIKGKHYLK
jgi:poly(A) polymerase/tRNA nucleotidyltransferase (CCA-adding enzyme)